MYMKSKQTDIITQCVPMGYFALNQYWDAQHSKQHNGTFLLVAISDLKVTWPTGSTAEGEIIQCDLRKKQSTQQLLVGSRTALCIVFISKIPEDKDGNYTGLNKEYNCISQNKMFYETDMAVQIWEPFSTEIYFACH